MPLLGQGPNGHSGRTTEVVAHLEGASATAPTREVPLSNTASALVAAAILPPARTPVALSSTTAAVPSGAAARDPLQDLWDLQRQISALSAQEEALTQKLQRMGMCPPPPPWRPTRSEATYVDLRFRALEKEISGGGFLLLFAVRLLNSSDPGLKSYAHG